MTNVLPIHGDYMRTLLEVHRAAQIPAAVSRLLDDGFHWLSEQLGAELHLFERALPPRPADRPLTLHGTGKQLQSRFDVAQRFLQQIDDSGGGSEVRIWPHHFDIATTIDLAEGGEEARSINVGLSPGDSTYSELYWSVTPWPGPVGSWPDLNIGSWHTDGFIAAVLPASQPVARF